MATILRSSKYVRNFTEFATKLGFSHIKCDTRASLISQRQPYLPSTFVKSLATQAAAQQSDNESRLEITLRRLDADVKRYGRISRGKLERIITAFQTAKSVSSTQALMVIRCCGNLVPDELPETRSELVNQVWKSLENSGIQLDLSHYNALLRVYVENEYPFSPAEILSELESKGIEPNKLTYQRIIDRYCQQGDIEGASKILEFMREKGISVNEKIFTALVRGHSEANDMVSAADILSVMRQAGLEPSADAYKELLCGYAKHGDMESITRTFAECQTQNIHLLDTDLLDVIFSLAKNGHGQHVEAVLSIMPKEVGYLPDALNHVLKLVYAGQIDIAMQVLFSIPDRDQGQSGGQVIKQIAKADLPVAQVLELCKQMEFKGINSRALLVALESYLLQGNVEGSLAILQTLNESGVKLREHYFWPIFIALGRSKNNEGIDNLLRTMKAEYGVPISGETLRDFVIPNKTGGIDEILAELLLLGIPSGSIACAIVHNLVGQMKLKEAADFASQHVFRYNSATFSRPFVAALAHTKDVTSFVRILQHIYQNRFNVKTQQNQDVAVNVNILEPYIIDLAAFLEEDKCEILTKVLGELLGVGLSISNPCVTTLQRMTGNQATPDLNRLFNRIKTKNAGFVPSSFLDTSACRLEIAKLEGSPEKLYGDDATVVATKKRLLYLYSRLKDLPNIEKLVAELKEQGVEFTDNMYKPLLDAYINLDLLDKTEECLTALRQLDPEYVLEDGRFIKYIVLLVKNDRVDDAVQFLKAQQNVEIRSIDINKTVWFRLLYTVADLGLPKAVNAIFDVLLQNDYIDISGRYLGALIKVHIVRDDMKEALAAFERICETYRHTPLKNELAKKLIQSEDATALQRLTDLSTQVHGETNSLYDLAQSFIESDCLRQAKKILEIPALHSKVHRLKLTSKRYSEQGMTIYLERLISVIKDVPYYKAVPEFYDDLLHCYDKENNWEAGLNLCNEMEEEEVDPSEIFLVTLSELLKRNNQPVPFTIPNSPHGQHVRKHSGSQLPRSPRNSSTLEQSVRRSEDDSGPDYLDSDSMHQKVPRAREESQVIESLVQNGKLNAAFEITESLSERNIYPLHRTFRFLIRRLGAAGEVELLEKLGKKLALLMKKSVDFDNNLCRAYIAAGRTGEYLDRLEKYLETVNDSDTETILADFPLVGVRNMFQEKPEFIERYTKMAEEQATRGIMQPINALWIHYFIHGQPEADKIWSEYLIKAPLVLYHSIIRAAQKDNNPELLRKLIKTLETAPFTDDSSKGLLYSALIKLCYMKGEYQESVDALRDALKVVSWENLENNTLRQMKSYLAAKGLALPADLLPGSEAPKDREQLIV